VNAATASASSSSSSSSGGTGSGGSTSSSGTSGSGGTSVGVTLAFNSIGWQAQNVLFNALDALLGDPLLASAFGGENPSDATATMLNTVVNAGGAVAVKAQTNATITSTISNTTTASSSSSSGSNNGGTGNTGGSSTSTLAGSQNL